MNEIKDIKKDIEEVDDVVVELRIAVAKLQEKSERWDKNEEKLDAYDKHLGIHKWKSRVIGLLIGGSLLTAFLNLTRILDWLSTR